MPVEKNDGLYRVTNPGVILAYPDLFEARGFGRRGQERGQPKYGAQFVFPSDHPEIPAIKARLAAVARATFPGATLSEMSFPLKSGNSYIANSLASAKREGKTGAELDAVTEKLAWAKDKFIIPARSKYQPNLGVLLNGHIVDLVDPAAVAANKDKFYFGVEVLVEFNFVAGKRTQADAKDWVTAYLNGIVSLNRGERIGSTGSPLAERFSGYVGAVSDDDPTRASNPADEIPL